MPLNITPTEAAAEVATLIEEAGTTVTLPDNSTIKAIVEERGDEIRRQTPADFLDTPEGRPALFYLKPADESKLSNGDILRYKGERFRIGYKRGFDPGDVSVMPIVLGFAGAV